MRFAKQVTGQAPRQVAWDLLWNIARLASCVPGCQSAAIVDPYARYRATVQEKVGPFRLTVSLDIDIVEHDAPQRLIAREWARSPPPRAM